jgi:ankyrin repeat protein
MGCTQSRIPKTRKVSKNNESENEGMDKIDEKPTEQKENSAENDGESEAQGALTSRSAASSKKLLAQKTNTLKLLIDNDPQSIDKSVDLKGNYPLHLAAIVGDVATMKTILAVTSDVNRQNNDGNTALHFAIGHNQAECARLLEPLADENIENNQGIRAANGHTGGMSLGLVYLYAANNVVKAEKALELIEANFYTIDNASFERSYLKAKSAMGTRWGDALENRCQALVKAMERLNFKQRLDSNPSAVDESLDRTGNRPIHIAACQGDMQVMPFLVLKCGGNVDVRTEDITNGFNTALHFAVAYDRINCVAALILLGADPELKNHERKTAKTGVRGDRFYKISEVPRVTTQVNIVFDFFATQDLIDPIGVDKFNKIWSNLKSIFGPAWGDELERRCSAISRHLAQRKRLQEVASAAPDAVAFADLDLDLDGEEEEVFADDNNDRLSAEGKSNKSVLEKAAADTGAFFGMAMCNLQNCL